MISQGNSDNQTEIAPENGLECVKTSKECSESRVKTIICADEQPDPTVYKQVEPRGIIPNFTIWEVNEAQLLKVMPLKREGGGRNP